MTITIPLKLPSLANSRMHWRAMMRVKQGQKEIVGFYLRESGVPPKLPAVITLTRIGKRILDDDNLASAFKAARDSVAAWVGVDDGSKLYTWRYEQRQGKEYAIEIRIES